MTREKSRSAITIEENISLFKCPVCEEKMRLESAKSLICANNHCFDLAKKGYVNLLLNAKKPKYGKEMFYSRKIIATMGFFRPMLEAISELIGKNLTRFNSKTIRVLDAGCGEGFHLSQIIESLIKNTGRAFQGVGIDIAKEGIQIAARNKDIIWCVADLARIPFKDGQFEVVLNILSPSNYSEFQRVLRNNGILLKVVPGKDYLRELRKLFYQETDKETYSNDKVKKLFSQNFSLLSTETVRYDVEITKEELEHLIKMTPLSWGASEEKIQQVLEESINKVTAEFIVMVGEKGWNKTLR